MTILLPNLLPFHFPTYDLFTSQLMTISLPNL